MNASISGLHSSPAMMPFQPGLSFPAEPTSGSSTGFQDLLLEAIAQVNESQSSADSAVGDFLAGGDITQVEVLTAMKKADLSLRMMLQMRNKLLEAFNEIKQMQM